MSLYDFFLFIKNVLPPVEEAQNSSTLYYNACTRREAQIATTVLCFSQIQEASEIGNYIIPNFVGVRTSHVSVSAQYARAVITIQALAGAAVTFKLDTCLQQFHQLKILPEECTVGLYEE
jgi:hypothetical protein